MVYLLSYGDYDAGNLPNKKCSQAGGKACTGIAMEMGFVTIRASVEVILRTKIRMVSATIVAGIPVRDRAVEEVFVADADSYSIIMKRCRM